MTRTLVHQSEKGSSSSSSESDESDDGYSDDGDVTKTDKRIVGF
jgi:hypothetical protein